MNLTKKIDVIEEDWQKSIKLSVSIFTLKVINNNFKNTVINSEYHK